MKPKHIAFFMTPNYCHISGSLPIVSALVRRGHRVTYAASELFAQTVTQLGGEVVARPRLELEKLTSQPLAPLLDDLTERTLAQVERFYEENCPDVILYDTIDFAGRILAHRLNVPAVQTTPHFAMDRVNLHKQIKDPITRNGVLELARELDALLAKFGMTGDSIFHRERLNIYPFPEFLQPGGAGDERLLFAGRCGGERAVQGNWRRTDSKKNPLVLVTASTTHVHNPDYFKICVAALGGLDLHVVLSVGERPQIAEGLSLPDNVEIATRTSHTKILAHADLLIYQGGSATSAEAAYYGVPVVVLSVGSLELEWLGDNLVDVGLGTHLKGKQPQASELREAVLGTLANSAVTRRAAELKRIVRREPGSEEASNRIEDLLAFASI